MNTQIVYLGHDNSIDVILKDDGTPVDLSGVTRMTLTFDSLLIDSDNGDADPIRWAKTGYLTGEIRLFLGAEALAVGTYRAPLVVYDPSNEEGVVWGRLPIRVVEEVEAPSGGP